MNAVELLRQQFAFAHGVLEGTMADITDEQLHWLPPGTAHPISALYAHIVLAEDGLLNGIARSAVPLVAGEWGPKTGLSAMPPAPGQDWTQWARTLRVDLPALRAYAQAVYAATDAYLATLSDADLDPMVGQEGTAFRMQRGVFLTNILAGHINNHTGEISSLKGLQGGKGYPF